MNGELDADDATLTATEEQIELLLQEAGVASDWAMVRIAEAALELGPESHPWKVCAMAIASAVEKDARPRPSK